ncbi:HAMP domain-containing histidine kinase [bacterium]|nr:HAMP domain-containing histidine kinase [bacterium]
MNIETFILLLSCIVNSLLAGFIYFKNPKEKINIFFTGSVLCLVLWTVAVIFARLTNEHVIWVKNAYFFSTLALLFFLLFLKYFPSPRLPFNEIIFFLLISVGVLFLLLIFPTRFLIKADSTITHLQGLDRSIVYGKGVDFYLYYMALFIIFVIISFIQKFQKANKTEKIQIKLTAIGILLFLLLATSTNLFIPRLLKVDLGNIGPAFSFIMVGFIGYAIGRYKLFELKVIAAEIIIILIWTILLIQIIVAENTFWKVVGSTVLIIFSVLGYSLVKSIYKEIEFRKKLQKAYQELQKLDKAKSEFLSIASHQLRTPLSIMKGYLSMILEGSYGRISPKITTITKKLFQTNEQLIKLVNNLLNVSRIEAGKIELQLKDISIASLIRETIKEIEPEAKEKGLYIDFKEKTKIPLIRIDPDKIKQVFLNILDNAIKYTEKGGIRITTQMQNSYVLIEVTDTGVGMTKEEIQNIFTSFKRGEAGEKFWTGGSGLGLYVAKKFVELHKGKIWAESRGKNKGSTFFIRLPVQ